MNVVTGARIPIKSWATDVEPGALAQATNAANLPFMLNHVGLMPDAHHGYGVPVGSVLFADKAIVPYAIGVDIGCGVALIETDMTLDDIEANLITDETVQSRIETFLRQIARDIPVGNGPRGQHPRNDSPAPESLFLAKGHKVSAAAGMAIMQAESQLGTLGGGNHFLELQVTDRLYGPDNDISHTPYPSEQRLWFMLHSGSRSVGHKICTHWHKIALDLNRKWYSQLPDPELAYLPWPSAEASGYWDDMQAALAWAEENRRRMAAAVISAFDRVFGAKASLVLDVHHNYAAWENHGGRNGIVHRKGAVRAAVGDTVLIPGSMSTGSYVAEGLGNPQSFNTCQHGAGRARSRTATRNMLTLDEMNQTLTDASVVLVTPDRAGVIDEAAVAYKDIESVMAASTDLIRPIRRHRPLGVVKG